MEFEGCRFARADLSGTSLSQAGAILADQDLIALSYTLAAGLGILLADGD